MLSPDLVEVNVEQQRNVWQLFRTHATVGTCVQAVRNIIFGAGIVIEPTTSSKGQRSHAADHQSEYYQQCIHKVANRALEWIICVGVVPVTFRKDPQYDNGLIPVVPVPESLKLFVRTSPQGDLQYEAQYQRSVSILTRAAESAPTPRVICWSKGEYTPTASGRLITPITHLENTERFVNFLRHQVMVAEGLRANPYHVTQARAKVNNDTDGVTWSAPDRIAQVAEQSRLVGVESNQRRQYMAHKENWGGADLERGDQLEVDCEPREYFLAAERELTRPTPVSSAVSELAVLLRQSEEKVMQMFGIPIGMFSNSGTSVQANYMQEYALNANMRRIKNQLQLFLNDCHSLCEQLSSTNADLDGSITTNAGKRKLEGCEDAERENHKQGATGEAADGEDTKPTPASEGFEACNKRYKQSNPPITIPGTPCVKPGEVMGLIDRGVLSFDEGAQLLRGLYGVPHNTSSKLEAQRKQAETEAIKFAKAGVDVVQSASAKKASDSMQHHRKLSIENK